MEKDEFIKVIHHYTHSSSEEAQQIISLKNKYPYSQLLHALSARVSKDHGLHGHDTELQLAAVYSADRAVLKNVMQKQDGVWPVSAEVTGQVHPPVPQSIYSPEKQTADHPHADVAEEVLHDLQILNELKHNFETMFMGTEVIVTKKTSSPILPPSHPDDSDEPEETKDIVKKEKSTGKTKAQRIRELAQELQKSESRNAEPSDTITPQKKSKKSGTENIIDEIANSKSKIAPESKKQKEQLEIIDQFIKVQPSISGPKTANAPQGDLSTIKSGEFGDNVISETLVDILLKQGKKDKAIEVLKKLIWKFPQKKAYFAAQIEELKK
jgi:hypothetical protein